MKKIWLLVVILSFCRIYIANGETAYFKVSDTIIQKSDTKQVMVAENVTLLTLRERKKNLEKNKLDYNADIDAQIAEVDSDIAEAVKLGIKEIDINGNIIQ